MNNQQVKNTRVTGKSAAQVLHAQPQAGCGYENSHVLTRGQAATGISHDLVWTEYQWDNLVSVDMYGYYENGEWLETIVTFTRGGVGGITETPDSQTSTTTYI